MLVSHAVMIWAEVAQPISLPITSADGSVLTFEQIPDVLQCVRAGLFLIVNWDRIELTFRPERVASLVLPSIDKFGTLVSALSPVIFIRLLLPTIFKLSVSCASFPAPPKLTKLPF